MNKDEFIILLEIHRQKKCNPDEISKKADIPLVKVNEIINEFRNNNIIDNSITEKGYETLKPYKVKNAIIMAAGFGLRSLPLSRIVPKGLYKVRNEVLIERQINQLMEAGINEIIVVVGYLKEKFYYLKEKYGVIIVENDDYYRYNNISSLYAARKYINNSYICCSDNYFNVNVFKDYVYDSYYSCKYTSEYAEEYCVTKTNGEYITEIIKGGSNAWYTIGEAYFSSKFSDVFFSYLEEEYQYSDVKKMLWDDFHIKHIEKLPLMLVKYSNQIVQEFDTIDDVKIFDPDFYVFEKQVLDEIEQMEYDFPKAFEKYDDIERYNSAITDQHNGRLHLNENMFGPTPKCLDILRTIQLQDLYEYDMTPDDFLIKKISKSFSMPEDDIFIHNGSAEILKSIFSIVLERNDTVLLPELGWNYYESLAVEKFCNIIKYSITKDDYSYYIDVRDMLNKAEQYNPKLIVITSPHNPTGCKISSEALEKVLKNNKDSLILLDEAYSGFYEEDIDIRRLVEAYSNLIISRTFSKYYGLANMRIGYAFCNFKVKRIWGLDLPLFKVNTISRKMAVQALEDKEYYENMCKKLRAAKQYFSDEMNSINGIRVFESYSNFVPIIIDKLNMTELKQFLQNNGILIRLFNDGNQVLARITISELEVMQKTVSLIKDVLKERGFKC